jgi:hypothetical protein
MMMSATLAASTRRSARLASTGCAAFILALTAGSAVEANGATGSSGPLAATLTHPKGQRELAAAVTATLMGKTAHGTLI